MKNLTSYNRFIIESLLLEAELILSYDFIDNLRKIKKNNRLADGIFKAFNSGDDYDIPYNKLETTDKIDMVSFLPTNKDDDYTNKKRSEVKIGRWVKSISQSLELNATDKEIEDFVNKWKSIKTSSDDRFEIVSGKDMIYWYNEENYAKGYGSLNKSCMRFEYSAKHLDMYFRNPEQVKLLIYVNKKEELLGRSLLWTVDKSPCSSNLFMDRIYTSDNYITNKFENWADNNNAFYKRYNGFNKKWAIQFIFKDNIIKGVTTLELKNKDLVALPYSDTFKYYNIHDGILSNIGFEGSVLLEDINGGYDTCRCGGDTYIDCDWCYNSGKSACSECDGERIDSNGDDCTHCKGEGETECSECDGKGVLPCDECLDWKKW